MYDVVVSNVPVGPTLLVGHINVGMFKFASRMNIEMSRQGIPAENYVESQQNIEDGEYHDITLYSEYYFAARLSFQFEVNSIIFLSARGLIRNMFVWIEFIPW